MRNQILIIFVIFLIVGCSSSNSRGGIKENKKGGPFDFSKMNLTINPEFIELRVDSVIAFLGDTCRHSTKRDCNRKSSSVLFGYKFAPRCSFEPCPFIWAEIAGKEMAWGNENEFLNLLGYIDSEEEARLWIYINGYDVIDDERFTISKHDSHYKIQAIKTHGCLRGKTLYQLDLEFIGLIVEKSSKIIEAHELCRQY